MTTTYPVYTPTEPTGPPPRDLLDSNNAQLVNTLKDRADFLTTSGRMYITARDALDTANHRLKHALNILTHRCKETHEERDKLRDELGVSKGLLDFTQNDLNTMRHAITGLEGTINRLRGNMAELERQLTGMQRTNDNLWQQYNNVRRERNRAIGERNRAIGERDRALGERDRARIQFAGALAQYNLVFGQLGQTNAQLAHANNRVNFGIQTLGRLRNRLFQQIAALRIQVQWFRIRQLNPPPPPLNNILPETIWLPLQ